MPVDIFYDNWVRPIRRRQPEWRGNPPYHGVSTTRLADKRVAIYKARQLFPVRDYRTGRARFLKDRSRVKSITVVFLGGILGSQTRFVKLQGQQTDLDSTLGKQSDLATITGR